MNVLSIIFSLANIILVIGTLLLIKEAYKNRNVLKGFSITGSLLTAVPCTMFGIAYIIMGEWLSLFLGSVTVFFWWFVFIYTLKNSWNKKPKENI